MGTHVPGPLHSTLKQANKQTNETKLKYRILSSVDHSEFSLGGGVDLLIQLSLPLKEHGCDGVY